MGHDHPSYVVEMVLVTCFSAKSYINKPHFVGRQQATALLPRSLTSYIVTSPFVMANSNEGRASGSSIEKDKSEDQRNNNTPPMLQTKPPKTPLERQNALNAALKVDPGVKRWSSRALQVSNTPVDVPQGVSEFLIRCILSPWWFVVVPVTVALTAR